MIETACHKTNRVRVYLPLLSWLSLGWSWLVHCSGRRWRHAGAWRRYGSSRPRNTVALEAGSPKCAEYWNFLWVLSHCIPFCWQKAVFWIHTMRSGSNFAKKNWRRGPVNELENGRAWGGGPRINVNVVRIDNSACVCWKGCSYVDASVPRV